MRIYISGFTSLDEVNEVLKVYNKLGWKWNNWRTMFQKLKPRELPISYNFSSFQRNWWFALKFWDNVTYSSQEKLKWSNEWYRIKDPTYIPYKDFILDYNKYLELIKDTNE